MSTLDERWNTEAKFRASGEPQDDVQRLEQTQERYIALDAAAADTVVTVRHTLGRRPRGVRVVNIELSAAGDPGWYRLSSDPAWTGQEISLRFRTGIVRALLEVF